MSPTSNKLTLFVDLDSALGLRAVTNLNRYLLLHYPDYGQAEIIDTRSHHTLLMKLKITATPCLVIHRGDFPPIKLIGDLSNMEKLQSFFDHFLGAIRNA